MLAYKVTVMDAASVRHAYRRWAPVYDVTFGQIAEAGRKHAVKIINRKRGRVLEVGVGTGLSLPCYGGHLTITGSTLAITGAFDSAAALSMRITCPGSGGTNPMRRAITSIRSGSRKEACSSRRARFISVKPLISRFADSI